MLGKLISKIIGGPAAEKAIDYFNRKQELKHELEIVQIQSEIEAEKEWMKWRVANINADAAWEQAQIQNAGWKDEWVLMLLSIPLVLVFIPWTAPYVLEGFAILETTPEWYRWLVLTIFAAIYGIRIWRRQV